MKNDVTIVTVTYNASKNLDFFKFSLEDNSEDIKEVIFVDNNSKDNTLQKISDINIKKIIINNSKNFGYAKAINIGIKAAIENGSEYILVTNNDVKYSHGAINVMKKESILSDAEVVGMVITNDGKLYKVADENRYYTKDEIKSSINGPTTILKEVDMAHGGAILFRKSFFEKLGLYDDKLFFGGDELDYSYRIKKYNSTNPNKIKCVVALGTLDKIDHLTKHDSRYKFKKAKYMLQGNARVNLKHKYSPISKGLYSEQLKEVKILSKDIWYRKIILIILGLRGLCVEIFRYYKRKIFGSD